METYTPVLLTILIAALMVGAALGIAAIAGPKPKVTKVKETPFECGYAPFEEPGKPFPVHFYIVAILFIVFDIEVIFLYPWVAAWGTVGSLGFLAVMFFITLLAFGLVYEWLRGGMEWR